MKHSLSFLKTTIIGGVLFLIPVILVIVTVGEAIEISNKIIEPLAQRIHLDLKESMVPSGFLAAGLIVLVCFLAGLVARTRFAGKGVAWLESSVLSSLPAYEFMKSMGESMLGIQKDRTYEVVLARTSVHAAWRIGFLIERMEGGRAAVYLPNAPSPWSGSVCFMTEEQIQPIDIPYPAALKCLGRLGAGSDDLLRGVDCVKGR